jgi:hypothetical protein
MYAFWCMDEFGWGNACLIIGEGKDPDKKGIVTNSPMKSLVIRFLSKTQWYVKILIQIYLVHLI